MPSEHLLGFSPIFRCPPNRVNSTHYKFGFIDKVGNVVIPIRYDNVAVNRGPVFSGGLTAVGTGRVGNFKYGYIDPSGNMVIQSQFDDANPFHDGLAMVRVGKMGGYIDKTGKFIIPLRDMILYDFSGGYAKVSTGFGDSYRDGYIDKTVKMVISLPIGLYAVNAFSEGFAVINEKSAGSYIYGYIDQAGSQVVPMQYDSAGQFSDGLALVSSKGRVGAINYSGQIVIPLQFAE